MATEGGYCVIGTGFDGAAHQSAAPYQPDGYTMLSRPWTAERSAAHEAYLASIVPPTLRVVEETPDPRDDPAFENGWLTPDSIALAAHGFPEPEDRSTAALSEFGDHECVQDLLRPGRIHVLAAEEGSGKTYLAKEIGLRVAGAGGHVAGTWRVLLTGPVLNLSEMHRDDDFEYEQTVLDSLGVQRSALAGRYYQLSLMTAAHGEPALMHREWRAYITAWLRRHGVRLLIVDTATGATLIDPWGKAIQQVYRDLRVMLSEVPELAILLILHLKKPQGRGERRISDVLGEWARWCDVLILLENAGAGRTKVSTHKRLHNQKRIVATRSGGLLIDPQELTEGTPSRKVAPDRVLAVIAAQPGIGYLRLAEELGVAKSTAENYVKALGDRVTRSASGPKGSIQLTMTAQPPDTAHHEGLGGPWVVSEDGVGGDHPTTQPPYMDKAVGRVVTTGSQVDGLAIEEDYPASAWEVD